MGEPTDGDRWLLPEGVDEVLPPRARALERLRRALLDLFHLAGFELVDPPLLEFVDSLTVAGGAELDLQTFKVVDQYTGRMMGLRPDITAQVARIDAAASSSRARRGLLRRPGVPRSPEGLFLPHAGARRGGTLWRAGPRGDAEVLALMGAVLEAVDAGPVVLELGHVASPSPAGRGAARGSGACRIRCASTQGHGGSRQPPVSVGSLGRARLLPKLYGDASVLKTSEQILAPCTRRWKALELEPFFGAAERTLGLQVTFDLAERTAMPITPVPFSPPTQVQGSVSRRAL